VEIPTQFVGRRAGDPVSVWADNRKARERLGWNPRYGLEEIVATAWKWQSSHPDGFR
jgi:UDP-glucose 4-epimerase